jgi:hypothetical protein
MGMDLIGRGGSMSLNWDDWRSLLELAEQYGWQPEGTTGPLDQGRLSQEGKDQASGHSWSGTYFSNDHQLVADSDARALGQALLRAADDVRKRDPRKSYGSYPCLPLVAALADFGCSGRFRIG